MNDHATHRGEAAHLNFTWHDYLADLPEIQSLTTTALVAKLRRQSSGFSHGASRFRGVTRHHQHGRWEARIGRVLGNRYLYLGTYPTEEEAAAAYDRAALRYRGSKAVTNFQLSNYQGMLDELKLESPEQQQLTQQGHGQQQQQQCRRPRAGAGIMLLKSQTISNDGTRLGSLTERGSTRVAVKSGSVNSLCSLAISTTKEAGDYAAGGKFSEATVKKLGVHFRGTLEAPLEGAVLVRRTDSLDSRDGSCLVGDMRRSSSSGAGTLRPGMDPMME